MGFSLPPKSFKTFFLTLLLLLLLLLLSLLLLWQWRRGHSVFAMMHMPQSFMWRSEDSFQD